MTDTHDPRCPWCLAFPEYVRYHDEEWGVPSHDEAHLFEMLILEGAQAGLSWATILKKREAYRAAFDGFDPEKMARYTPKKIEKLLADPGIVRNRLKVQAAVGNAQAYLKLRDERGGLAPYLWDFVDGEPVVNRSGRFQRCPPRPPCPRPSAGISRSAASASWGRPSAMPTCSRWGW